MDDNFFREILRRSKRTFEARPEIPLGEMMFTIAGPEQVTSTHEINASGEPTVFVCARTETAPPECVVSGSIEQICSRCQKPVWMSPATCLTYAQLSRAEITCMQCAGLMLDAMNKEKP